MKDLKLTLYDWLGYLIPGTILLTCIYYVLKGTEFLNGFNFDQNFINGFIFFTMAYFSGHVIHSIANYTIDLFSFGGYPPKEYFIKKFQNDLNTNQIDAISMILVNKFNIKPGENKIDDLKNNYWLCYANVVEMKEDSLTQTFLNLTGFYRGSSISAILSSIILITKSFLVPDNMSFIALGIVLLISSFLLFLRTKRFK